MVELFPLLIGWEFIYYSEICLQFCQAFVSIKWRFRYLQAIMTEVNCEIVGFCAT